MKALHSGPYGTSTAEWFLSAAYPCFRLTGKAAATLLFLDFDARCTFGKPLAYGSVGCVASADSKQLSHLRDKFLAEFHWLVHVWPLADSERNILFKRC